jgi:hypothetical protein
MRLRIVVGLIAAIIPVQTALAQDFPNQSEICENGIVVKSKLARKFINANRDWQALYINADAQVSDARYRPLWRGIFTNPNFCVNNPGCIAENPDKKVNGKNVLDTTVAEKTLQNLRDSFAAELQTQTGPGQRYLIADFRIGANYFLGDDKTNAMTCTAVQWLQAAKKPPGISLPIRLRSSTDELSIASGDPAFKTTKPAKITYSNDTSVTNKQVQTVTLIGALGYPIPLPLDKVPVPSYLNYLTGEFVPYVSANQTITKKQALPSTYSASSYTAAGTLFDSQAIFTALPGVNNVLSVAPQYLWNSSDRSEITSVKANYAPWTLQGVGGSPSDPQINSVFTPGGALGASTLQLYFNARYDLGYYNRRGNNPMMSYTSFSRGGTQVGFAVDTPISNGPHATLSVTETLLYGFTGQVRQLSLLDAEWTYYFDSTSNLAFSLSYKVGRDEDTAEKEQIWTAGLAAKF